MIGNGRTLQEDTVICGYKIPKGIQVVFPTIVTGTMEEYCEDANAFRPERWLKISHGGTGEHIHPFASLPYGYGARMCLGRRFADLEMQILLAKVDRYLSPKQSKKCDVNVSCYFITAHENTQIGI